MAKSAPQGATPPVFRATALWLSAAAAMVAFLGLLGYLPGLRALASIRPDYIPMAVTTAACFLVLAAVVFLQARKPSTHPGRRMAMEVPAILVTLFALLNVAGSIIGMDLNFEDRLVPELGRLGKFSIGHMSPAAGAVFVMAGLGAFLLLLRSRSSRHARRLGHWAASLGILTILAGATVILSYLYGVPLLYSGSAVPMAATTALAFLFLGTALVAKAGPESYPMLWVTGDSTSARLSRVFLPLTMAMVLLQGILSRFVTASSRINHALFLAALVIVAGAITAMLVVRVAHSIGGSLDEASTKLRQSEARAQALLRTIPDLLFRLDRQGVFLDYKADSKDLYAQSGPTLVGQRLRDIVPPAFADLIDLKTRAALETGALQTFEYRLPIPGRGERDYEARLAASGADEVTAIVRDITERKQAEAALRENNSRLELAMQSAEMSWWEMDIATGGVTFERRKAEMLGYPPEKFTHYKDFTDLVLPGDRERAMDAMRRHLDGAAEKYDVEYRISTQAGGYLWFHDIGSVVQRDAGGKPLKVTGLVINVTERKRAEKALQESEEKYRVLIENSHDIIYTLTADGVFNFVSPAWTALLGQPLTEVIGKPFQQFIHPDDIPGCMAWLQKVIATGERQEGVDAYRVRHADGSWRLHISSAVPLRDKAGKVIGFEGTARDITERRQAEVYREMGREILQKLNQPGDMPDSIQSIIATLKARTGFDAVGMRLRDGDDFPYFAQVGFSGDFLLTENTLLDRDAAGGVCRDKDGQISLECTCGLVISGKTDPANPFFTPGGSFWTNDSSPLLELTLEQDPRRHPRNQCIHQGYASVALVPIRMKEQIVGLLQLNDHRKGCFSPGSIEQLENIAMHIGEALMRKQAEAALQKSELQLKAMLDNSPVVILLIQEGKLIYMNPAAEKMTGWREEEFLGKSFTDFVHEDDQDTVIKKNMERMSENSPMAPYVIRINKKKGGFIYAEVNGTVIHLDGKPTMLGFLTDISERHNAEAALKKSENEFHLLAESMPQIVWITRPDGWNIYFNRRWVAYTGLTLEESYGHGWNKPFHPDDQQMAWDAWQNAVTKNSTYSLECRLRRFDGVYKWWLIRGVPLLDEHGAIIKWFGTCTDIDDMKKSELALIESAAEKEVLLKEVHHRIKNNIASISGLLSMRLQSTRNPEAAAVLQDAIGRVDSMRLLYDKMLLSEGYKDVSVKNYVESLADTVVALFPDRARITVEKRVADFQLEPKRLFPLGLVINELLTNKLKYAFVGRKSGTIRISLADENGRVTLVMEDDGVGLPQGFDIAKVKGFGLTLVKMLSQQLGGSFTIESHGQGTRSRIEFSV